MREARRPKVLFIICNQPCVGRLGLSIDHAARNTFGRRPSTERSAV